MRYASRKPLVHFVVFGNNVAIPKILQQRAQHVISVTMRHLGIAILLALGQLVQGVFFGHVRLLFKRLSS